MQPILNVPLTPDECHLINDAIETWLDEYGYVRNDSDSSLYQKYHKMVSLAKALGVPDWESYASAGRDY